LVRFPEYAASDLYISSESYGGHYIPTLAKQIVTANAAGTNPQLNFKGFAVGNPYTDSYSGTPAMIDTYWGHQLIDKPTYDSYYQECRDSKRPHVKKCELLAVQIMTGVGNLNSYALDYPVCTSGSLASRGRAQRTWLMRSQLAEYSDAERKAMGVTETVDGAYEPCVDDYANTYLNQKSVQQALHVISSTALKATNWGECSYTIKYNTTDSVYVSTAPLYNELVNGNYNLKMLVYSGDDDSVCGTIGTQSWIWDLGYKVSGRSWRTYTYNEQTAGYATVWENTGLGFLTIHGAGHEVPTYKPDVSLDMWTRYLKGEFTSNQ